MFGGTLSPLRFIVNAPPLQIVTVLLPIDGVGYTLTVKSSTFEQLFAVRVILYITSIGAVVVLVSVSLMLAPEPLAAALEMPVTAARVQLYVVVPDEEFEAV